MNDTILRQHLAKSLDWGDAHATFTAALANFDPGLRGERPAGCPYSGWELLEHLRISQRDILDFCRDPDYRERSWPGDYWPPAEERPTLAAWDASVAAFRVDLEALRAMALDSSLDLGATIPHGTGQTYLRELLLVVDHNAYHLGQLILVRRLLGAWPAA